MVLQGVCWLLQALQQHFQNPEFKVFADKVGPNKMLSRWPLVLCINLSGLSLPLCRYLGALQQFSISTQNIHIKANSY